MAYGRLDVFFPDGVFKTFLLTTSPITVGRSTGSTIPLETDTISRYHFSLTHDADQVTLVDMESANGTFIDGERIAHNTPRVLYGGEEILIGELRLIFHNLDDSPTRPINVPEEATARHEQASADFRVEVENPSQAIPPGAHISGTVTIHNTGSAARTYSIEVEGMPKGWTRIDRPEIEIAAGERADIILSFKPIRRFDSAPGDYSAHVIVRTRDSADPPLTCPVRLRVLPYSGFGMALATRNLESDGAFRLYVQNQGSAPLPLALMGRDLPNRLRFIFPMASMTLAPGQRAAIDGHVRPRQPLLFGEARVHTFDLIVRSCDSSGFLVAARGYVSEKPALPSWAGFAGVGIGVSLLILMVLALLLLARPNTTPSIQAFTVSSARVAQGEPLQANWQVTNAENVSLAVVSVPADASSSAEMLSTLATIDPRTNTAAIDTAALIGDVRVVLIALNGDQSARMEQPVFVYAPLMVTQFTFDPPRVVRYVAQTITVSWSVSGAITTQLSGLAPWSQTPLDSTYPASATAAITGVPTEPIELILSAQSANADTLTQSYAIPVIDPECTARETNTPIYLGPAITHQVIGSASPAAPLVVDGTTQARDWLRVGLGGGATGWGQRAAFTCADTFNPDDLRVEANIPVTPTPLPTLPPPTTPLPTPAIVGGASANNAANAGDAAITGAGDMAAGTSLSAPPAVQSAPLPTPTTAG